MARRQPGKQTTLRSRATLSGIGVHSGRTVAVTVHPAEADTGIMFLRTGCDGRDIEIPADYRYVRPADLCTTVADGEVAGGMTGLDPTTNGQLTKDEIKRAEADPAARLKLSARDVPEPVARSKGPRYTPVAKRQDRPDAIAWLLKVHPELQDSQVAKLVGSTKSTVQSVRDRTHWNMQNVRPRDPVTLGLCSLKDLNDAVDKARRKAARDDATRKRAQVAAGEPVQDTPVEEVDPSEADQPDFDTDDDADTNEHRH